MKGQNFLKVTGILMIVGAVFSIITSVLVGGLGAVAAGAGAASGLTGAYWVLLFLTLVVGIRPDGTVTGISFTELHETAGMGMRCDEPEFKSQFENVNVTAFTLNKGGASTAEDVIDSINGASVSSGAVVDAVNAALSYFAANLK